MLSMKGLTGLLLLMASHVAALASTDTITWGGDNSRASYETTHNMDPVVVASDQFAQLFEATLPGDYGGQPEGIFSQPLVYTPNSSDVQYVYWATTQNNIYKMNAKTGSIVLSRNLHIPFSQADLDGCTDIEPYIGITGTGVIDPDTDTLYLAAKTYEDQNITTPQGRPAGRYYIHAIDVNDLSERPGFPISLEGLVPRNSPTRHFNGGIQLQRPALLHVGQYIYAGFGSHCVQYNFTGWLIGWDKTTGELVEHWATEGEGVSNSISGGSLWMSGGGIASDDDGSLYFATGNGYASQLSTIPVDGHQPPTAIEEAAVHMTINDDGSISFVDFFMPWNKQELDGDDKDLGVTPLVLLPSEFSCGNYEHIGVVTDKFGLTYFLDMDNLGGYRNGADGLDDVIGSYQNEDAVYSGAGVYPLEGGWVYITVVGNPTHAFQFSCDDGLPSFTHAGESAESAAVIRGVGHGTVTSLDGQAGTGLLWVSDVRAPQLRIYNAIPSDGSLVLIKEFTADGVTKFTHPMFGDGIVYLGTTKGVVYAIGAPVTEPLNCTSPVDFGNASIGATGSIATVSCMAVIEVTIDSISLNVTQFNISGLPTMPVTLAAGKTFAFLAGFEPNTVGDETASIKISTTNSKSGYSTTTVVRLDGNGVSQAPVLEVSPTNLTWSDITTGLYADGINETFILSNVGNSVLTVSGYEVSETGAEGSFVSGTSISKFTFYDLPSTIAGNSAVTINTNFDSSNNGTFVGYLRVNSDGGNVTLEVYAHSGGPPVTLLQFLTPDGTGWVDFVSGQNFTFGNVTEDTTRSLKLKMTNNAVAGSNALTLTVSKPPFGLADSIIQSVNDADLGEGTSIAAGESQNATLYCDAPKSQWDVDAYTDYATWTINTDDDNFGKHTISFGCTVVSEQAAPLDGSGQAVYRYVGCFKENNPGRQLSKQLYSNANNTNAMCIAQCAAGGYTYCGTQYQVECWAGDTIPVEQVDDDDCNYACGGDVNEICGGNGVGTDSGGAFISLFTDPNASSGTGTGSTSSSGPVVNPGIDGYVSLGCYKEPSAVRALRYEFSPGNKTVDVCLNYCAGKYVYAGLEYGGECWCDNQLNSGANATVASDCDMACAGNSSEYCGAGNRLNLYQMNGTAALSSSISSTSASLTRGSTSKTISTSTPSSSSQPTVAGSSSSSFIVSSLTSKLSSSSLAIAWTNSSSSILLSSSTSHLVLSSQASSSILGSSSVTSLSPIVSSIIPATGSIRSSTASSQSSSSVAMSSSSMAVPHSSSAIASTLQTDSSSTPILSLTYTSTQTLLSTSSATNTSPSTSASRSSLVISSTVDSSSTSATISSSSLSSSALITPTSSSLATTSSSLSSSTTTSHAPIPTGPFINPGVDGYLSLGCYTEATSGRALEYQQRVTNETVADCLSTCAGKYTYAGLEYGGECWCADEFGTGVEAAPASECSMTCNGNQTEYCGGSLRLNVYEYGTTKPVGGPYINPGIDGYTYQGCYTEPLSGRALRYQQSVETETVAGCLSICAGTYTYAGLEYGGECWCDNILANGANLTATTDCSMTCNDNSTEYCGAGLRFDLYMNES